MGAYGITTTVGTGSAADAWTYSFTEPDPLTAVVELSHPSTVSLYSIQSMLFSLFVAALSLDRRCYQEWSSSDIGPWVRLTHNDIVI